MGKAFANELAALSNTLKWARTVDLGPLERFVHDVAGLPLVAIGSGGSATACHFTALLHRARHKRPAFHTTPLDVLSSPPGLHRAGVFLASASGKNKDVLTALDACIADEAPAVGAITLRANSPLGGVARRYPRVRVFEAELPSGKDGYLATNTLIATCALASRAYGFDVVTPESQAVSDVGELFRDRHMVQVLFGGWAAPVATDLESKLNESALASAQLADYRNFGHGRHLWLAKRGLETVVIALITPSMAAIAEATLKLFPKNVRVVRLETKHDGPAGTLELLLQAFHLIEQVGRERGQDPGRPHVPEFGRRLYHLSPPPVLWPEKPAVQRKQRAAPTDSVYAGERFEAALERFLNAARRARVGAIALDYDGTLCTKEERYKGLREDIVAECSRLLAAGIQLGIATGRGKSVREELQRVLDQSLWARVLVGYYNGTDIATLADDQAPSRDGAPDDVLNQARVLLDGDALLKEVTTITARPHQLTVEPKRSIRTDALAAHVMACLAPLDGGGLRIVCSTHSLDVLGAREGKVALVSALRKKLGDDLEVLCIGDRGAWPGNDYALLSQPLSLSVDEVSSLDGSCWNLAPSGVCGPDATVLYLRAVRIRKAVGSFVWKEGAKR
jgi:hypothetical protein